MVVVVVVAAVPAAACGFDAIMICTSSRSQLDDDVSAGETLHFRRFLLSLCPVLCRAVWCLYIGVLSFVL